MKAGEYEDFELLLIDAEDSALSDWESDFTLDMSNKYAKYGDEMYVSEKQIEKLEKIAGW